MSEKLKKQLIELEKKYGGYLTNVKRNIISPLEKNYYNVHTGGDRMAGKPYHGYAELYSKFLLKYVNKKDVYLAEVGILTGIGLSIWCDIFDSSNIYGFDIDINIFKKNLNNLISLGAFKNNKTKVFSFYQFNDNNDYIKIC